MSVISTHKTRVALYPCDTLQLEEEASAETNTPAECLYSLQDCAQSLYDRDHDDWSCSRYSDTESDASILSPSYDYESPYNKEAELRHWTFEAGQCMPLEDTMSWRESGLWSILSEGGWPRSD